MCEIRGWFGIVSLAAQRNQSMIRALAPLMVLIMVGIETDTFGQVPDQGPNPDVHYRLGPDSLAQDGVPKGEIRGPFTLPSEVFPGTKHTYWVYVPAQYDRSVPANLMVFNDGQTFMAPKGEVRAQNVFDNLSP
jgi:enterochelin esterase family protein